ncbi:KxYKxGKxW signal peptide domain-containing protein [Leuconostoc gelidum subsp. gelidum]|nr:KxYKxGKxW signal peptide domain-containing protein [Leuconostoc gelidum subsp. gelidum]MBZ6001309.1 KxYKxGKxW signal peptide domain-containing protein [Leuconostoc gelidum subsp. gelidum]MBZ6010861.1 KxYKxGKxW signal peptide domain-containing protein [Leuconostoc gelidum subsp. aenigmaticum]MBZ6014607.1 KxYKxGKxW signal peptide domain-containing protein [Leuconostoc gelidum subsp. gelidum]
MYKSGKLWVI